MRLFTRDESGARILVQTGSWQLMPILPWGLLPPYTSGGFTLAHVSLEWSAYVGRVEAHAILFGFGVYFWYLKRDPHRKRRMEEEASAINKRLALGEELIDWAASEPCAPIGMMTDLSECIFCSVDMHWDEEKARYSSEEHYDGCAYEAAKELEER